MRLGPKLELSLLNRDNSLNDFARLTKLVWQYNCPAMVVNPLLVAGAIIDRSTKSGPLPSIRYKVVAAVDFPDGGQYAIDKFKNCPRDFMSADGFEIMLSNGSKAHIHNEMKAIYEWVRAMNPLAEIRWVIPDKAQDEAITAIAQGAARFQPNFLKFSHKTEEATTHKLALIKKHYKGLIKLGGDVNFKAMNVFHTKIDRFDVLPAQLDQIIKESLPLKEWPSL